MKIAVVHSFYSSSQPSGENRVVEDQVAALRSVGNDVKLIARHTDEESGSFGYSTRSAVRVSTGRGSSPLKEIAKFEPDIVHVHNLFPNFGTHWVRDLARPVVLSLHNYRPFCSNGLLYRQGRICFDCVIEGDHNAVINACYHGSRLATVPVAIGRRVDRRNVLGHVSAVIMTSEGASQVLSPLLDSSVEQVLIPNFGSGGVVEPLSSDSRQGWLAMGRLSPEKGFVELARIWPEHESLTIIGDGELRDSVQRAAVGTNVVVKRSVPIDELRTQLPHFRGLIFPSRWLEVAPQVVVEAMRGGLPVVAYEANVVASLVRSTGTGVVYSDSDSLAESLNAVTADLKGFSARAVRHYLENWTPDVWLTRMTAVYESLLLKAGRP